MLPLLKWVLLAVLLSKRKIEYLTIWKHSHFLSLTRLLYEAHERLLLSGFKPTKVVPYNNSRKVYEMTNVTLEHINISKALGIVNLAIELNNMLEWLYENTRHCSRLQRVPP